ncbi:CDP-glycerol:poly(glycerophosphate) glycerophosphotransferase [Actinocorallia herbida]|uniref:CDP-glycerol:poly(Glycerophosphate) glycerophosphotransferase n=1 Tax=Actinocorallia herbida TaxID=58109 RepID=A0A3N1D451_9ACTN|nr:CDP-glycerol:poly(glycerophosphate) glycerophosphotransferase [Actinocorallia herbida]
MPILSVVVPFHNVAEYLDSCLSSLAAQTVTDLEVIMVDDGSTDDGARIAESWTVRDERFRLIRREHGGPGAARNTGVARARGAFLAFADGDDVVPPDAYDLMLRTLERTGSDLVSGGVQRIGTFGTKPSHLHGRAILGERLRTHITKTPSLLYDVTMWNKVIRRSLWDEHTLSFPEGVLYEDIQLAVRLHCLARRVDVITEPIYLWRERSGGNPSITQKRDAPENLRDRISALLNIDSFLAAHAPRRLRRAHHHKALTNDLPLYFKELHRVDDDYRTLFLDRVNAYLDRVPRRAYRALPSGEKLRFHLARRGRMPELLDLLAWQRAAKPGALPVVRERLRLYADLPFRGDKAIPARVFRLTSAETRPVTRVDEVSWRDGRLRLAGRAYVPYRDLDDRRHTSKFLVLRAPGRLPRVVRMRSELHAEATARSGQDRYVYDWSGFSCAVNPGRLAGDWRCHVIVRGHGLVRSAPLTVPVRGRPQRPPYAELGRDVRMVTRWSGDQLCLSVQPLRVIATGFRLDGDDLELTTRLSGPVESAELLVKRGATAHELPAAVVAGVCSARVPLDLLVDSDSADDYASWETYLRLDGGEPIRIAATALLAEERFTHRLREVAVLHTRDGNLSIAERTFRPVIETEEWTSEGVLVLRGSYRGPGPLEAVLRRRGTGDLHTFPFVQDGVRFEVRLALREAEAFGRRAPLLDGTWDITVREGAPHEDRLIYTKFDHGHLPNLAEKPVVLDGKRLRFLCSQYDTPVIEVEADSRPDERGAYAQRQLQERYYPLHRDLRMRDQLVFVSWKGKQCSDNPRAIADELRRRGDDREHIWVVRDTSLEAPPGATVVRQWSRDYYRALARSKYVVANDDMPSSYVKRDGQTYVQTWHGTPLKKIGFDIGQVRFASGNAYLEHLEKDVSKWDVMLSPNPFSTPILREAFRFTGEMLETGYPRNDLLHSPTAPLVAARVRARLGIGEGKKVVLYAPTWRDDQFYGGGRYRFDQRLDLLRARKEMGEDHVFLVRGHHLIADDLYDPSYGDFVINVSAYPDITDLYLISDVLITDYSSAMFDFAGTGRPMLFFTYDLETYRDTLRGFYFDFEERAPGPLLMTSDEVLDALGDLAGTTSAHAAAYRRFQADFHPVGGTPAASLVADRLC